MLTTSIQTKSTGATMIFPKTTGVNLKNAEYCPAEVSFTWVIR